MKMKAFLALTAVLSFGAAAAQGTTTTAAQATVISDVPAGHWAKDAVDRLVREGVILGYPDGTYRGNQNLTRYQAAVIIARVLDRVAQNGTAGISDETLTSLQNAVQELAADLAALGVRVSDLEENAATKEDIARIEERLESLNVPGGDGAAAGELATQLTELTTRVDELSSNFDTLRADVDDNASSIAALNDLTVLLNQDILSLQDRVSAIEAGFVERTEFDALGNRVTGVEGRVNTLEAGRVSVSGVNFSVQYGQTSLVSGPTNFDVDRLTVNSPVGGAFGGGDIADADGDPETFTSSGAVFTVGIGGLSAANGGFTVSNASLGIGINALFTAPTGTDTTLYLNNATINGSFANNPFSFNYHRSASNFNFQPYLFNNNNGARRGAVVSITASDLPLQPKVTAVIGNGAVGAGSTQYFGVRGEVNAFGLGTLGLSFAQANGLRSGFGADFNLNTLGVNLTGAYSATVASNGVETFGVDRAQAFYTNASTTLGPVALRGNFRAVDPRFAGGVAGLSQSVATGDASLPYAADTFGFGVGANTTFGIISLGAYYDSQTDYVSTAPNPQEVGFGVNAAANNLFAGFSLSARYDNATLNGAQVTLIDNNDGANNVIAGGDYFTRFGVTLTHNGAAANALIPNLNITASYFNHYDDSVGSFGINNITAYADYNANLGGVTLRPFARYNSVAFPAGSTRGVEGGENQSGTTTKFGLQATAPFTGVIFAPSVTAGVSYRTTAWADGISTSELYAGGALTLGQFLSPNTTFTVGYSYYTGTNLSGIATGTADANNAFNAASDVIYSGNGLSATRNLAATAGANLTRNQSGTLNGLYAQLGYSGFTAAYGVFNLEQAGVNSTVNSFKLGYNVRF